MKDRTIPPLAIAVLVCATLVGALSARQNDRTVLVPVLATSEGNALTAGLKQNSFQLFEDNREQKITSFFPQNTPMSVSIILGAGAMVRSDRVSDKILEAVDAFKKTGNLANEYFVDPYPKTGIEDAIARGLDRLAGAKNPRRVLVMFIDNFDTPANAEEGALESAMKQDVPIYFMFIKNQFFRFNGTPTTTENDAAYPTSWMNVFEEVARDTGGSVIMTEPMGNLQDETVKLADELANEYVLGFVPGDTKLGKWHNLKLTLKSGPPQKVTLRYRRKYFLFR